MKNPDFLFEPPLFELGACYSRLDTNVVMWFVRRANHVSVNILVQIRVEYATLSGKEELIKNENRGKT